MGPGLLAVTNVNIDKGHSDFTAKRLKQMVMCSIYVGDRKGGACRVLGPVFTFAEGVDTSVKKRSRG